MKFKDFQRLTKAQQKQHFEKIKAKAYEAKEKAAKS